MHKVKIKALDDFLREHYPTRGKMWCVANGGFKESEVRTRAARLGLRIDRNSDHFKEWQNRAALTKIGKKRPAHSAIMKKKVLAGELPHMTRNRTWEEKLNISRHAKERIAKNGHPRGALGLKLSDDAKAAMKEGAIKMWADKNHRVNSEEYRQLLSDRVSRLNASKSMRNGYSRGRMGTYNIGGKEMFFRSLWEANYALYLDYLIKIGHIKSWQFEVKTFWFEAIKRGVRSYKPDFEVVLLDGSIEYHEVKGWMDDKSKTKLKRMGKYHPTVAIVLIEQKGYKEIKSKMGKMLGFFE